MPPKRPRLERPPLEMYKNKFFALSERKTTGAYDDQQPNTKRRKTDGGRKHYMERPASMLFPATSMAALTFGRYEASIMMPRALRGASKKDPIASTGELGRLPTEVRDVIFRHMLLSPKEISLLRGWSLVFPRDCPKLELALIRTCEVFRRQGLRILYGENRFVYRNRDPNERHDATPWVLEKVFKHSHFPIDRYGHLIRYIRINVEHNRMGRDHRDNFARSLAKFGPKSNILCAANLHTVTIEVPVMTLQDIADRNGAIDAVANPSDVPIRRFFNKSAIEALEQLNTKFIHILAIDKQNRNLETVIDMRYYMSHKRRKRRLGRYPEANYDEDDDKFAGDELMKHKREELTRASLIHLRNSPMSLEFLARYPQNAIYKWKLWNFAAPIPKPPARDISLSDKFGESSSIISLRSEVTPSEDPATRENTSPGNLSVEDLERIYSESTELAGSDHARQTILDPDSLPPLSTLKFMQNVNLERKAAKNLRLRQIITTPTTDNAKPAGTNSRLEAKSSVKKVQHVARSNNSNDRTQRPAETGRPTTSSSLGSSRARHPLTPPPESPDVPPLPVYTEKECPNKKDMRTPTTSQFSEEELLRKREYVDKLDRRAAPGMALFRAKTVTKEKKEAMRVAREAARVAAAVLAQATQTGDTEAKEAATQEVATKERAMDEATAAYAEAKTACTKAREYCEIAHKQFKEEDAREHREECKRRRMRRAQKQDREHGDETEHGEGHGKEDQRQPETNEETQQRTSQDAGTQPEQENGHPPQ